jgi:FkbM family methyltransferase
MNKIRQYLQKYPQIYDLTRNWWWRVKKQKNPAWLFFESFSKSHHQKVNFIQIGANDGIKNDPIRGFIIRDNWSGIFVEPLPTVFNLLKNNYRYVQKSQLIFVNAAISPVKNSELSFWTFSDQFLNTLSEEEKLSWLRKSSFEKNHLKNHLKKYYHNQNLSFEDILTKITVPCLTINGLIEKYWQGDQFNLLVIDAEGYESSIIQGIDFNYFAPEAIFFESAHLGKGKKIVYEFLSNHQYKITELGMDSIAEKK